MQESTRALSILLAEDSPTDAELCLDTLREHSIANQIHWVRDGAEALDFLFAEGRYSDRAGEPLPQLLLLDLAMPKVDGLEVLRHIRADARTRGLPVVMMTSSQEERDISESYDLGVNSYVSKPVALEEFAATVARLGLYWTRLNRSAPGDAPG